MTPWGRLAGRLLAESFEFRANFPSHAWQQLVSHPLYRGEELFPARNGKGILAPERK